MMRAHFIGRIKRIRERNVSLLMIFLSLSSSLWAAESTPSVRFGEIEVSPVNALIISELHRLNKQFAQQIVNDNNYREVTQRLLELPVSQGYYYATLNLRTIEPITNDSIIYLNPSFYLDWGEQVRVDTIIWEGINRTSPLFLNHYTAPLKGQVYYPKLVKELRDRFSSFPFLQIQDGYDIVKTVDGRYGLVVPLRERNDNLFSGVLGYVPGQLNVAGYFTGEMDLKLLNIGGMGRGFEVFWSKPDRYSQRLRLRGMAPSIAGTAYFTEGEFQQTLRDTLVVIRELSLGLGKYIRSGLRWQGRIDYTSTLPTEGGRTRLGLKNITIAGLSGNFVFDNRDNPYNPRRGYYIRMLQGFSQRREADTAKRWQYQSEVTFEADWQVTAHWSIASITNYKARYLKGKLSYSDYYWFGGARSLRGYPEEFFHGTQIGWTTAELRWMMNGQNRMFIFFDQGYCRTNAVRQTPHSYGIGFRLESRLGLIGLDYGFGPGDTFSTAKLHIHVENWF